MKTIIIPENIFKISNITNYIYISNKDKKELDNNTSKIFNAINNINNCEFVINLKTKEKIKKSKINIDFKENYLYKAFSKFSNNNLKIVLKNNNFNIRSWENIEKTPINLNQLEIVVENTNYIHMNKYSFNEICNNINKIILHNVYKIHKLAWHPCSNSTFVIKNDENKNVQIFPQIGLNSTLDLTNIKNINFVFPLFNIYYQGETFKEEINYSMILQQIVMGPSLIINKDSNFYEENFDLNIKSMGNTFNKSLYLPLELFKIKQNVKYRPFKEFIDFNNKDNIKIEFRNLWLLIAKDQLKYENNYYTSGTKAKLRKKILEHIILIIEEANTKQEFNILNLKEYEKFLDYIDSISINKNNKSKVSKYCYLSCFE